MTERASATKPARTLKQRAIALLARRDYARADLASRLSATGAAKAEIDRVLDELESKGYLSDARFAAAVVRQKAGHFGKRAIAHALRQKGVAAAALDEAMRALDQTDELAAARALWQRKFGAPPSDERDMARQLRFLVSRGYPTSIAYRVLRAAGAKVEGETDA